MIPGELATAAAQTFDWTWSQTVTEGMFLELFVPVPPTDYHSLDFMRAFRRAWLQVNEPDRAGEGTFIGLAAGQGDGWLFEEGEGLPPGMLASLQRPPSRPHSAPARSGAATAAAAAAIPVGAAAVVAPESWQSSRPAAAVPRTRGLDDARQASAGEAAVGRARPSAPVPLEEADEVLDDETDDGTRADQDRDTDEAPAAEVPSEDDDYCQDNAVAEPALAAGRMLLLPHVSCDVVEDESLPASPCSPQPNLGLSQIGVACAAGQVVSQSPNAASVNSYTDEQFDVLSEGEGSAHGAAASDRRSPGASIDEDVLCGSGGIEPGGPT